MTLPKSQQWRLEVYQVEHQLPYIAYAVHGKTGKVEREGQYVDLTKAILAGGDLVNMLNLYHPYAGKYKGTDAIVGRQVDPKQVADLQQHWSQKFRDLILASEELLKNRKNKTVASEEATP